MDAWLAGLIGGLIATVAFTVVVMPFMAGVPLAATSLIARLTGRGNDPGGAGLPGLLLHLAYGSAGGLVFGVLASDVLEWTTNLWAWGILYGAVLQALALVFWGPVTRMSALMNDLPSDARTRLVLAMAVAHVVYGLLVGALVESMTG